MICLEISTSILEAPGFGFKGLDIPGMQAQALTNKSTLFAIPMEDPYWIQLTKDHQKRILRDIGQALVIAI